jgi:hypothetical protein
MALSTVIDVTSDFNVAGLKNIDVSGWDWVTVQLVGPAAAVTFNGSNDDGSVTGALQGGPLQATNFTAIQGINLNTGVGATTGAVAGLWRFPVISRFLQLSGTTATKILVYLSKIG